jgi:hypothetical protein
LKVEINVGSSKMRFFKTSALVLAVCFAASAAAEFKPQCHSSGGQEPAKPRKYERPPLPSDPDITRPYVPAPDQVAGYAGGSSGNDNISATFDQQSLPSQGSAGVKSKSLNPRVAAGYSKEEWKALTRKERRKIIRDFLKERAKGLATSAADYIAANSVSNGALNTASIQGVQSAFEEVKRVPASFAPASATPATSYDVLLGSGTGAAK